MSNKLYLLFIMFCGVCVGEMDANESSETMIDTTNTANIDKLNWYNFNIVFDSATTWTTW